MRHTDKKEKTMDIEGRKEENVRQRQIKVERKKLKGEKKTAKIEL